jgi:large subunit ribosomal protein L16
MKTQPKSTKFKKTRKRRQNPIFEFKTNALKFGNIGLKSTVSGTITAKQIEAARQTIVRKIKRKGKVWIRIFPHIPVTSKPTESRMGKGKGAVSHWCAYVKGGTTLFEMCGVSKQTAKEALISGSAKLPVTTKIFD